MSPWPDSLQWRWTANGLYSACSCYQVLFLSSTTSPHWELTWHTWASLRIRFFIWLANQDRCWTAARPDRHGLPHHDACMLCDQAPETMHHLLVQCPYTRIVWHKIMAWCRVPVTLPTPDIEFLQWWADATKAAPATLRKGLASIMLLSAWSIWKHQLLRLRQCTAMLLGSFAIHQR